MPKSPEGKWPSAESDAIDDKFEQFKEQQKELINKYGIAITAAVEKAIDDGKTWLDMGSVVPALDSFYREMRLDKNYRGDYLFFLATAGTGQVKELLERRLNNSHDITLVSGLLRW
jgi:hypothetical protein